MGSICKWRPPFFFVKVAGDQCLQLRAKDVARGFPHSVTDFFSPSYGLSFTAFIPSILWTYQAENRARRITCFSGAPSHPASGCGEHTRRRKARLQLGPHAQRRSADAFVAVERNYLRERFVSLASKA